MIHFGFFCKHLVPITASELEILRQMNSAQLPTSVNALSLCWYLDQLKPHLHYLNHTSHLSTRYSGTQSQPRIISPVEIWPGEKDCYANRTTMYRKCGRGANAPPKCQSIHGIACLLTYVRRHHLKGEAGSSEEDQRLVEYHHTHVRHISHSSLVFLSYQDILRGLS